MICPEWQDAGLPWPSAKHSNRVSLRANISVGKGAVLESSRSLTYFEHGKGARFIATRYWGVFVLDELPLPHRVGIQALATTLRRSLVHFLQVMNCHLSIWKQSRQVTFRTGTSQLQSIALTSILMNSLWQGEYLRYHWMVMAIFSGQEKDNTLRRNTQLWLKSIGFREHMMRAIEKSYLSTRYLCLHTWISLKTAEALSAAKQEETGSDGRMLQASRFF